MSTPGLTWISRILKLDELAAITVGLFLPSPFPQQVQKFKSSAVIGYKLILRHLYLGLTCRKMLEGKMKKMYGRPGFYPPPPPLMQLQLIYVIEILTMRTESLDLFIILQILQDHVFFKRLYKTKEDCWRLPHQHQESAHPCCHWLTVYHIQYNAQISARPKPMQKSGLKYYKSIMWTISGAAEISLSKNVV